MDDILETDENFEIVASTLKCIYDQTCRKCGCLNRVIFYQLKEGRDGRKTAGGIETGTMTPARGLAVAATGAADSASTKGGTTGH